MEKGGNDQISVHFSRFGEVNFSVEKVKDTDPAHPWIILYGKTKKNTSLRFLLKSDDYFQSPTVDLMDFKHNEWRVKATHKETNDEIKKRIVAQIDYLVAYFNLIDENKYNAFKISHLTSPYKFYANGIGLFPSEATPEWNALFYDAEDAEKAHQLLIEGLQSISKYPADTESYTKGYSNALKEIRNFLVL